MAMLEGDAVVYVAQVPSPHSMRMFTEVGRRVMPHCTGVGKALLSPAAGRARCARSWPRTGHAGADRPHDHRRRTRCWPSWPECARQGYAVDDGEQEVGVRCLAVPVEGGPGSIAISVSGPSGRLTEERIPQIVPVLHRVAVDLGAELRESVAG